ncbi:MAG: hypothetical protein IJ693_07555 [Bacteroidaceae bacterium]|nr:hypothetical protein [Bacteroidaceae bacterium]
MIKKLFIAATIFAASVGTKAESLQVKDVVLPQNGTASIEIELNNSDMVFEGFTFSVQFPEEIIPVLNAGGYPEFEKGERLSANQIPVSNYVTDERLANFALLTNGEAIAGTNGMLIAPTIKLATTAAVGTTFTITISKIVFTTPIPSKEELDDVTFKVTVDEPLDGRTVLDETSTTAPVAATGVDVRVKRTIKAGDWGTIVLPFNMSEEQVKEAFGEDVLLADFTSWSSEEDEEGNIMGIEVDFTEIHEIEANHPCLIKVSSTISEFTVDGVDIEAEDEPTVQVGKKKAERGYLTGTYVANTFVPEDNLFLSGNHFYYSTGATKMKAFRAYFEFADVLASVESSSAKIRFSVSEAEEKEEVTGLSGRSAESRAGTGVFTLQGMPLGGKTVDELPKGVYVVDGKKVVKN